MGQRTIIRTLLICCCLASSAAALTADDYVRAGRAALFERTATSLAQACDIFALAKEDVACPAGRENRELIFLHAAARTARLFVDHPDVLSSQDFLALATAFDIPLDGLVFWHGEGRGTRTGYDEGRSDTRRLRETIFAELEAVIADFNTIDDAPEPFVVRLTPEETGLTGDLEIDYGDVLILKGLLLAYKGYLAMPAGQTFPLEGSDLATLLSRLTASASQVADDTEARDDWTAALNCCIAAVETIATENDPAGADPQEDEFVYVDAGAEPRLAAYRDMLATLRSALTAGQGDPVPAQERRTYELYDADTSLIGQLTLVFDAQRREGCTGRLALADGTALEVDWFGALVEGRTGVSLYSEPHELEGWLEVSLSADLNAIADATLDLWGARATSFDGLTGRAVTIEAQPTMAYFAAAGPAALWAGQQDRAVESVEVFVPVSHLWLALGNAAAFAVR
jgi:hypothetical protein